MKMAQRIKGIHASFTGELLLLGSFVGAVSCRAVHGKQLYGSPVELCLLWLVCLGVGALTTPRSEQNLRTVLGILLVPFSLDLLGDLDEDLALMTLLICLAAVILYSLWVLVNLLRSRDKGLFRRKKGRFFRRYLFRCRRLVTWVCTAVVVVCSVYGAVEESKAVLTPAPVIDGAQLLQTMGGDEELIRQLCQSRWEKLGEDQRLAVLQQVADAECAYLGIPESLCICTKDLEHHSLYGYYVHGNQVVCINRHLLDSAPADRVLSVLLHEIYHAFEHAVVEVYDRTDPAYQNLQLFEKTRIYSGEFDNYISGTENYDAYSAQAVEKDSNLYSDSRIQDYRTVLQWLEATEGHFFGGA